MYIPKSLPRGYTKRDALCFFEKEKYLVIREMEKCAEDQKERLKNSLDIINENLGVISAYPDDWSFNITYESGSNISSR